MFRPLFAVLLIASPAAAVPVQAQTPPTGTGPAAGQQAETGQPPQRIRQINLAAGQSCPKAEADEIVVCSRIDPNEQYRVPKELRRPPEVPAANQSWVNRAATADRVGRVAGGLPNTCSPVGTGGQTGCGVIAAGNFSAEKRQKAREAEATAPGEIVVPEDDDRE